jgi:hypothetical protein
MATHVTSPPLLVMGIPLELSIYDDSTHESTTCFESRTDA